VKIGSIGDPLRSKFFGDPFGSKFFDDPLGSKLLFVFIVCVGHRGAGLFILIVQALK